MPLDIYIGLISDYQIQGLDVIIYLYDIDF
jgi:hypothetical protein